MPTAGSTSRETGAVYAHVYKITGDIRRQVQKVVKGDGGNNGGDKQLHDALRTPLHWLFGQLTYALWPPD